MTLATNLRHILKAISGMSSSMTISHVPHDVLWCIFDALAGSDIAYRISKPHPIDLMRTVSQVCTSWRTTAIESASLWARLIDIYFLCNSSDQWREEILARTKGVLLEVYGSGLNLERDTIRNFIRELLHNELQRIKVFIVHSTSPCCGRDETLLDPLWRKQATNLITFEWHMPPDFNVQRQEHILFNNCAPSLRHLNVSFPLYFPPVTSWLGGLTALYLRAFPESLSWILNLLRRVPQLATLNLYQLNTSTGPPSDNAAVEARRTLLPISMMSLRDLRVSFNSLDILIALLSLMRFQEDVLHKCYVNVALATNRSMPCRPVTFQPYHC
ncbi:hypothetical protein D9613_009703 [Agrocybe pediades]|uniref:F-box domain-containing protein n=1 Tax=Agrocybe pediades TaxID=84607 RepID=A0A8H4QXH2_9AGAR|nr:hypothetical protein D9613_009703 [Agrocybe pediades]